MVVGSCILVGSLQSEPVDNLKEVTCGIPGENTNKKQAGEEGARARLKQNAIQEVPRPEPRGIQDDFWAAPGPVPRMIRGLTLCRKKKARPKSISLVLSLVSLSGSTSSTSQFQSNPGPQSCVEILDSSSEEEIVDGTIQSLASTPSATASTTSRPKQSWIWTHFDESKDPDYAVCQVHHKNGKFCVFTLKKDRTGSTKNFHKHLCQIHNVKVTKQPKAVGVYSMETYLKTSKLVKQPKLTANSLKSTIVLFLAECNLSFSLVKKNLFLHLLVLLNEEACNIL
ncbi:uncharacterized protein VP01_1896g1 [Puccinia sorghi]|uniref:BED-type domain-containing protein n=1 Tax=Puccinia sorghi TaxID=27349 RepID=A0A0L6VDG8_9BASI|nr:uncharacterized protein VP01_1896g1 [Puccinia sorghi]